MKKQQQEVVESGKLNEIVFIETRRPDGSLRIQQDFQFCPTLTEQHTAHLTDINYLMEKYKPDELAAYIAARSAHRTEILGHDFSLEPNMQGAKNAIYEMRKAFAELPEEIRGQFKSHVEFMKFIDNPRNQEKMIKMGLLKQAQIEKLTGEPTEDKKDANAERSDKAKDDKVK